MRVTIVFKKRVTIHRTIAFRRRGDGCEDANAKKKKTASSSLTVSTRR